MSDERLTYDVKEAAALLGISASAYHEALNRGDVPGYKVGRRCLVPRIQLHEFIERGPASMQPNGAAS